MNQSTETSPRSPTDPLKLTAAAVNHLIKILPAGTAKLHRDRLSRYDDREIGAIPLGV